METIKNPQSGNLESVNHRKKEGALLKRTGKDARFRPSSRKAEGLNAPSQGHADRTRQHPDLLGDKQHCIFPISYYLLNSILFCVIGGSARGMAVCPTPPPRKSPSVASRFLFGGSLWSSQSPSRFPSRSRESSLPIPEPYACPVDEKRFNNYMSLKGLYGQRAVEAAPPEQESRSWVCPLISMGRRFVPSWLFGSLAPISPNPVLSGQLPTDSVHRPRNLFTVVIKIT